MKFQIPDSENESQIPDFKKKPQIPDSENKSQIPDFKN